MGLGDQRLAGVVGLVVIAVGAVGVGDAFPVPGGATERLEWQRRRELQQRVGDDRELTTAAGVQRAAGPARGPGDAQGARRQCRPALREGGDEARRRIR